MFTGFINGCTSYLKAFDLITRYRLWGYIWVPALISIALGATIFGTAWTVSDDLGGWLISFYPWELGKGVLTKIANVFGGLFVGVIGLILFKHLVLAIASPFMSFLSEKVENAMTGSIGGISLTVPQMLKDLIRGLTIAIRNIIRELFYTLLLFLLGVLIPIFLPFTTIFIFLVQAFYAGFGNIDYTLERHFNVRGSVQFVRKNRGLAIGNGAIFVLLLLTGIGFLFALPLGTVAATTETMKRISPQSTV